MIAFLIKSSICMVLLFGLYWLLLRKEKLFIFTRFYLILSVLLSLTIPFISFSINLGYNKATTDILTILNRTQELNPIQNKVSLSGPETSLSRNSESDFPNQSAAGKPRAMDSKKIFLLIYLSGFALMLIRFCRNILLVNEMFRKSEKIDQEWFKIALVDHPVNPFSFLRTVYINKQDFLENRIAANVLKHELEHVRQSHSCDIIFFEMLSIVFWFNPVLFLYKWAAKINHEYLADEAVVTSISDIKTYADELINFINLRVGVPFTSGFSPSTIRHRLLMLNTNTTRRSKNIRMLIILSTSVLLMCVLSFRPADPDAQDHIIKKGSADNKDIIIEDVSFRGPDFKPLKALVIMDGRKLGTDEMFTVDPQQIKTIDILKDRKAIRKYGRNAKNGVVEISTYEINKKSAPDSLKFKPIYTVNNKIPEGLISIPVSNLYSLSIWTYPVFPNQDLKRRWRTIEIMTRDYYQIRGKVVQNNGEPLPGVLITSPDYPSKKRTGNDGRFLLEDIRPDVVFELSSEGFEPLYIKVKEGVFSTDLNITLDRINETNQNDISLNHNIKDFSGAWKLNNELTMKLNNEMSKIPFPGFSSVCAIRQYDSDSILLNFTQTADNGTESKDIQRFVFNTVKREKPAILENIRSLLICSIASDGHSFSVTNQIKSTIGLFKEFKNTQTFSLSDDEKRMIIRINYFHDGSAVNEKEFQVLVFDRI